MTKKKFLIAVLVLGIVTFPLNLLFEVTAVPATDNYRPVNSDYRLNVSVNLDNLSIYLVNSTTGNYTSTNLTSKIVTSNSYPASL